jgi:CubicO group peptidase (beta-lactamase class C family)
MTVHGTCDPAFAAVRDVFSDNFARGGEVGAGITVYQDGRPVVDLWGGQADRRTGREWERDTPCVAFSCTKAVTAAAAALLAEREAYDVDGPVTGWWPEFGAHGKEGATAAHLLSHQVGLPAFQRPVTAEEALDPAALAAQLAGQAPEWTPGTAHGYHATTYGWLAGEIIRRLTGKPVGEFVKAEFAGDLDLWIGAPDKVIERAAKLTAKGPQPDPGGDALAEAGTGATPDLRSQLAQAYLDPGSQMNRALANPAPGKRGFNNPVVLRGGWPSASMVTTPRALAGFYRKLIAGEIVKPDTLRAATQVRAKGKDRTLLVTTAFGLGFMRPSMSFLVPKAARASAFGHTGAGGSIGLGDPEHGLAMAYVMNRMGTEISGDLRAYRLVEAVYDSLG